MTADVVIDLETTGTSAGCCVLSIGAVSLNFKHEFYQKISHKDSTKMGLVDDPDTLIWWNRQSPEARTEAFSGDTPVLEAIGKFADWMTMVRKVEGDTFVWGNGADFDLPILGHLYNLHNMQKPWRPFNGRCYRTLKNLPQAKDIKADAFVGVKHNALEDAKHQARHMLKIIRTLASKQSA